MGEATTPPLLIPSWATERTFTMKDLELFSLLGQPVWLLAVWHFSSTSYGMKTVWGNAAYSNLWQVPHYSEVDLSDASEQVIIRVDELLKSLQDTPSTPFVSKRWMMFPKGQPVPMDISSGIVRLKMRGWKWEHNPKKDEHDGEVKEGKDETEKEKEEEEEETVISCLLNVGCVVKEDLEEKRMAETMRYTSSRIYMFTTDGNKKIMENPAATKARCNRMIGCTAHCCTSDGIGAHFPREAEAQALVNRIASSSSPQANATTTTTTTNTTTPSTSPTTTTTTTTTPSTSPNAVPLAPLRAPPVSYGDLVYCSDHPAQHAKENEIESQEWTRMKVTYIRDPGSGQPAFLVEEEDITELKKIQHELEVQRLHISFLANISHEIRTPLNGIIGMLQHLLYMAVSSNTANDEVIDSIQTALFSAHSISELVTSILDLSKMEQGQMKVNYCKEKWSNIIRMINDIAKLQAWRAEQKGCDIYVEYPLRFLFVEDGYNNAKASATASSSSSSSFIPSLALTRRGREFGDFGVVTDLHLLKQVANNLLSNAIKYSGAKDVVLSLSYDQDSKQLNLSVRDSGVGIPKDKQDWIFQKFTQLENQTREGTGLGLPICKEIAHLMKGKLSLDSEEGKGSAFCLSVSTDASLWFSSDDRASSPRPSTPRGALSKSHSFSLSRRGSRQGLVSEGIPGPLITTEGLIEALIEGEKAGSRSGWAKRKWDSCQAFDVALLNGGKRRRPDFTALFITESERLISTLKSCFNGCEEFVKCCFCNSIEQGCDTIRELGGSIDFVVLDESVYFTAPPDQSSKQKMLLGLSMHTATLNNRDTASSIDTEPVVQRCLGIRSSIVAIAQEMKGRENERDKGQDDSDDIHFVLLSSTQLANALDSLKTASDEEEEEDNEDEGKQEGGITKELDFSQWTVVRKPLEPIKLLEVFGFNKIAREEEKRLMKEANIAPLSVGRRNSKHALLAQQQPQQPQEPQPPQQQPQQQPQLPSQQPQDNQPTESENKAGPIVPAPNPVSGMHVLVVEDNMINVKVITRLLARLPCIVGVDVAYNGQEGVKMFKEKAEKAEEEGGEGYGMVLMDVRMPIMDGYAATQEIRVWEDAIRHPDKKEEEGEEGEGKEKEVEGEEGKNENGTEEQEGRNQDEDEYYFDFDDDYDDEDEDEDDYLGVPIIGLSAGSSTNEVELCFASGMNDFLGKPVSMEKLVEIIRRWATPRLLPNNSN